MRQKLRRGEWLTKAPFGYVNNPKTRNIEPDPVKSKIIVRAFEEYANGNHTLKSMAEFLADLGITTKSGTPLGKASIKRILTNKAYLGFTKHYGEYFEGSFAPILSLQQFEAVQKVLETRARPRKAKTRHDFPFTGLFKCGECDSGITAQWATGRHGGRYRYYRCTKKKGPCSQSYLREEALIQQLKTQLQTVALCDESVEYMLKKVASWEKEETSSSQSFVQNLQTKQTTVNQKMDKLVTTYIDGDIPKAAYLKKKDNLLKEKLHLREQKDNFGQKGKNWIEPLRSFILDTKQANFLACSDEYGQMKAFVQKIGMNPRVRNKSISFSFAPIFEFLSSRKARSSAGGAQRSRSDSCRNVAESARVLFCDPTGNRTPLSRMRT